MTASNTVKKTTKHRLLIVIIAFVLSFGVLFYGATTLYQYNKIKPYKALATELNTVLGGGYKTSYTWRCSLESTNCPSARMIKDANFKDNDEAKTTIEGYRTELIADGLTDVKRGICEADQYISVYCSLDAKKNKLVVTINAKQDFIGVDITP